MRHLAAASPLPRVRFVTDGWPPAGWPAGQVISVDRADRTFPVQPGTAHLRRSRMPHPVMTGLARPIRSRPVRRVPSAARGPPPGWPKITASGGGTTPMKRSIARLLVATVAALSLLTTFGGPALAQAGHFVGTPTCTDIGTQVRCTGKVAGLGGTTFTILVSAPGTATVSAPTRAATWPRGRPSTPPRPGKVGPSPRRATARPGSP
jgi:hypothetical protein